MMLTPPVPVVDVSLAPHQNDRCLLPCIKALALWGTCLSPSKEFHAVTAAQARIEP